MRVGGSGHVGLCCNVEGLQLQGHVGVLDHEGGAIV